VAGNVGISIAGSYGHLTLNANGSYSYALNNASVEGLRDGQTVLDTFTYTISDGRGGAANAVSTSTLTVTVHGRPSAVLIAPEDLEALEETLEIMRDAATMNRLAESDAELARGEYVSAEELAEAMRRRQAH